MPFAVKSLFDVKGIPTLAGSKINADLPPAEADATAIRRLEDAGAVLVGTLNMDEYAYGFTTENAHYGVTRNPHDKNHVAGGSSGGSAAAVAAGLVPLALGSDTNGSIRVPASFCGIWGLKPTFGRLSRAGTFPFVSSLDHVGPIAAHLRDLALAYDSLQGADQADPVCSASSIEPVSPLLDAGTAGIRMARATGYFDDNAHPEVVRTVCQAAEPLGAERALEFPDIAIARAAATVITAVEAGQLHLPNLRRRQQDFDPLVVNRLIAGAIAPSAWYIAAQRARRRCAGKIFKLFDQVDVVIAPATPFSAQRIGQETVELRGRTLPARATAGVLTQPLSCVGLPILSAPLGEIEGLPFGLQIIAAPWREDLCFRVARALELRGLATARISPMQA
jgi:1-carboxybiuret hydrolase